MSTPAPAAPAALSESFDLVLPEFDAPPAEPVGLLREWFATATRLGVREPGVVALATVDSHGRASTRMVQTSKLTDAGLVFTSHATSPKGRDIAATGWASGVLYWRETRQQVVLTGPVEQLSVAASDELWYTRPPGTHPMSVASHQSDPLDDEEALRAYARQLAEAGEPLPRPLAWVGYQLAPTTVEFWHGSLDRLHRRLRYDRTEEGWGSIRLQP